MLHSKNRRHSAFTIVELIVVISVIAILAIIVIVSYGSWRHSVLVAQVKSDLNTAAATADKNKTFAGGYTVDSLAGFTAGDGIDVDLFSFGDTTFCIDGTANGGIEYHIDNLNKDQGAAEGSCEDRPSQDPPSQPTISSLTTVSVSALSMTWGAASGAVTYDVQCASDQGFVSNFVSQTITAPTVTSSLTSLLSNTTYFCRVRAVNTKGSGNWSDLKSASTNAVTPSGLAVSANTTSDAALSWTAIPGAISYDIQRATDNGFTTNVVTTTFSQNAGTSSDLVTDTTYYFRIRTTNNAGQSGWSSGVTAARTTITDGLLAWWPLNGNANDRTAVGVDGTVTGPTLTTGQNDRTNGAYSFDGVDDYINYGEKYNSQAVPLSISMWVYRQPGGNMFFVWDDTVTVYYGINWTVAKDGSVSFLYMDGDGTGSADRRSFSTDNNLVPDRSWHHVVATVSGATTGTVYVDGVAYPITYTDGTGSAMAHTTSGPMRMGIRTRSGPVYSTGSYDDVRLFNRVLTAEEATTLYEAGAW